MLKNSFMLAVGSVFAFTAAHAADMYHADSLKDTPVAVATNWTGFYIGGHAGVAFGSGDRKTDVTLTDETTGEEFGPDDDPNFDAKIPDDFKIDNGSQAGDKDFFLGGFHLGYNFQRAGSPWVFGIEGDASFGDEVEYVATLRGRLGYAAGHSLFYATAGVALADFGDSLDVLYIGERTDDRPVDPDGDTRYSLSGNDIQPFGGSGGDDVETGFVVGGGAEFKIRPDVSFGIEGLYYLFDDVKSKVSFIDLDPQDAEIATFTQETDPDFWVLRARLTYHVNEAQESLK